jgi:hypothetical protein
MSAQVGHQVGLQPHPVGKRQPTVVGQGAADDPMNVVRIMFGIHESHGLRSRFRAWRATRARAHPSDSDGLDRAWVRHELDRSCSAYEAALGDKSPADSMTSTRSERVR